MTRSDPPVVRGRLGTDKTTMKTTITATMRTAFAGCVVVALAAVAVGCADAPDDSDASNTSVDITTAATTLPETTSVQTTLAPTTTAVIETTTTEPPAPAPLGSLVLADDGIGPWRFGDESEEVISGIAAVLGTPSADTGWMSAEELLCPGTERRRVEWGVFRLDFGDGGRPDTVGERSFIAWDYGLEARLGEEPRGLITARGVGLGARVDELVDAYPDVELSPGEEGIFSASFVINDNLSGLITGVAADDTVTVMSGGEICGD